MYPFTDAYLMHEWQRELLAPWAFFTGAAAQAFSSPYSPLAYTPVSRELSASYELAYRLSKDYERPQWQLPLTNIDGKSVKVEPEVVLAQPFCHLVHFKRDIQREDPRILIVAPLSGHHATLLRDTVRALLPSYDVYITEWIDARMVPIAEGTFSLEDYVHYIQTFLRHLGRDLHVISVCQPAVPVMAAIALLATAHEPCQPRTMIMMGGPIDARKSPTQVSCLATTHPYEWFESHLIYHVPSRYPGAGREVYPGFLQHAGFVAMNPARHFKSHYEFYLHLLEGDEEDAETHRRFYDEYNSVLDMPARYYLDCIRIVFQEFRLAEGTWFIDDQHVDLGAIHDTALLTIEGELDDISGQGQTHCAHALCTGLPAPMHDRYTAKGSGHFGIFSGSKWRKFVRPKISEFIEAQTRLNP